MLEQLLAEIRKGGPQTTASLAQRLKTRVGMVDAMLDRLVHCGFIRPVEVSCAEPGCQGCSLSGLCKEISPASGRLWVLSK